MSRFQNTDNEPAFDEFVYQHREEQWKHMPYEEELLVLDMIKRGDVDALAKYPRDNLHTDHSYLSENPLRQKKYEFVAAITSVTRVAIEAGLDMEATYALSDSYIRLIDKINDIDQLRPIFRKMSLDYAQRIKDAKKIVSFSKNVLLCMDYIEKNLHYSIFLLDLAEHIQKTPSYLSALFKKEVGKTINEYITLRRLEESKRMLAHTTLPISEIATTLSFNSQSYFTSIFKKHFNETPLQYRNNCFRIRKY